jgi:hypothetical protein
MMHVARQLQQQQQQQQQQQPLAQAAPPHHASTPQQQHHQQPPRSMLPGGPVRAKTKSALCSVDPLPDRSFMEDDAQRAAALTQPPAAITPGQVCVMG